MSNMTNILGQVKQKKYDNGTKGALNIENVVLRSCDIRITVASCMAI